MARMTMPPRSRPALLLAAFLPLAAYLPLAAFLLLPAASAQGQAFRALFERLGDTVDAYERGYFGFFPGLEGFSSATLLAEGDSLRFVVHRSPGAADSSIGLSRRQTVLLERLVDGYESILADYPAASDDWPEDPDRRELELRFGLLQERGILKLRRASMSDVPLVKVELRDGDAYKGRLLAFSDSGVLLHLDEVPYRWRSARGGLVDIRYGKIKRVTQYARGSVLRGMGTGFAIGTAAGMFLLTDTFEGEHNSGNAPLFPTIDELLPWSALFFGLPGAVIGGLVDLTSTRTGTLDGPSLPGAWREHPATADSLFLRARAPLPPELPLRYRSAPQPSPLPLPEGRSAAASAFGEAQAAPEPSIIQQSLALDYGINSYDAYSRGIGISFGGSFSIEYPIMLDDSRRLLSLRPRLGLGFGFCRNYQLFELELLTPRSGGVYLFGGMACQRMYEDFGTFGWGMRTEVVQHNFVDHLFGCGGIGFTIDRSRLEIRVRNSFHRIVVTSGNSQSEMWEPPPAPTRITTVTLSWGWPL